MKWRKDKNTGATLLEPEAVLLDEPKDAHVFKPNRAQRRAAAREAAKQTLADHNPGMSRNARRRLERKLAREVSKS